jgi:hypothetical protein
LSIKEQNLAILFENEQLRTKIQELEEHIQSKEQTIKILKEKR